MCLSTPWWIFAVSTSAPLPTGETNMAGRCWRSSPVYWRKKAGARLIVKHGLPSISRFALTDSSHCPVPILKRRSSSPWRRDSDSDSAVILKRLSDLVISSWSASISALRRFDFEDKVTDMNKMLTIQEFEEASRLLWRKACVLLRPLRSRQWGNPELFNPPLGTAIRLPKPKPWFMSDPTRLPQ